MAIIDINLNPSKRDLKWFGVVLFLLFLLLGSVVYWRTGTSRVSVALWLAGTVFGAVYYLISPLQRPLYLGFMHLVYPIGWVVSHLLFAFIFYLLITPIGIILRVLGHDSMQRHVGGDVATNWVKRDSTIESSRIFSQF